MPPLDMNGRPLPRWGTFRFQVESKLAFVRFRSGSHLSLSPVDVDISLFCIAYRLPAGAFHLTPPPVAVVASSRFFSSRSFCRTSSSSLSTPYRSASLRWRVARARSRASPASGFAFPPPPPPPSPKRCFAVLLLGGEVAVEAVVSCSRPCCSSDRAFRASTRRSARAAWASARSSSVAMAGAISSRSEASASARVGWGISS